MIDDDIANVNSQVLAPYDVKLVFNPKLGCTGCGASKQNVCLASSSISCGGFINALIGRIDDVFIEPGPNYKHEEFIEFVKTTVAMKDVHS